MPGMYRIIAFICLLVAAMAYWGDNYTLSLVFFGQTAFFAALSYMKLSERIYLSIFNAYMVIFFVCFVYYIFFYAPLTGPTALH